MKIGRYEVCGLLGRGGMGAVYKVRQPVTGRIAALKLLKPTDILEDLVGMESLAEQFENEAKIMASLDHPHVAAVWDYDMAEDRPFFVMEYYCLNLGMLIGESYRVEAPTRRLPLDRAVSYAMQTLSALRRMHHAGIVHRDVKPFNIMITGNDEVKLIDFGLSRLRGETPGMEPGGVKVGSPYYAPPEQEENPDTVDGRADLFPVGVMLYRMLTGILPNDEDVLEDGKIPPASRYSEDLDVNWDAFFYKAIAASPEKRFSDAATMMEALSKLLERWKARVENVCSLLEPEHSQVPCPVKEGALRQQPVKVLPEHARDAFGLDALWRPVCKSNKAFTTNTDGTVTDAESGLLWQQGGSDFALTWQEAHDYISMLNDTHYAGYADWRLPTVAELATLIEEPPMLGDFCLPSIFAKEQETLWTCDQKSYMAAWFVSAGMGFVGWQDFTCRFGVRAVRTIDFAQQAESTAA